MQQNLNKLKGVGEAQSRKLNKLGLITVEDLINHYPRRYDDFSQITPISKLKPGQVTVKGEITNAAMRRSRRGTSITEALIEDSSSAVKAVWFNQPYLAKSLPKNESVYVSGILEFKYNQFALQSPSVERVSDFPKNTARIVPVYGETAGLSSKQIRSLVIQVLPAIKKLPENLPSEVVKSSKLISHAEALTQIHYPESTEELKKAKRRIAFEELFFLILAGLIIKNEVKTEPSVRIVFKEDTAKRFTSKLPFKLTNAQRKAAWDILQDIDSKSPMNRLLEGDVGSGKTVVAAMAMQMASVNGYQSVLMAPTEVLARQHLATFKTLKLFGKQVVFLASGVSKSEKAEALELLENGKAFVAVGTHALLEEAVKFNNLGLVIIDEQHRFGVKQRQALRAKAKYLPHLLSMSATPIPRSLALTVYGDLDVSVISELPPGRTPVQTKIATTYERDDVYAHIDEEVQKGQQVFVICPMISDSDTLGVKSVETEARRLKKGVFKHRKITVVHGKMKPSEKQQAMENFKNRKFDILVATTVVEVGVDVPNATIMLIEGAERFGLATLHQLRGRVGRGNAPGYCYLISSVDKQSRQRLELLEQYSDGFVLAQKDLELRGPGQLYGQLQHGLLDLRMADIGDAKLISEVLKSAQSFIDANPSLVKYPLVLERVNKLKNLTSLD